MFGILLAGVGDHLGTGLRKTVAKIETLFLVRPLNRDSNVFYNFTMYFPPLVSSCCVVSLLLTEMAG